MWCLQEKTVDLATHRFSPPIRRGGGGISTALREATALADQAPINFYRRLATALSTRCNRAMHRGYTSYSNIFNGRRRLRAGAEVHLLGHIAAKIWLFAAARVTAIMLNRLGQTVAWRLNDNRLIAVTEFKEGWIAGLNVHQLMND